MTLVPGQDDGWDIDLIIPSQQHILGLELLFGISGTIDLSMGGSDELILNLGSDGPQGPPGPQGPQGEPGEDGVGGGGGTGGCCYIEADGPVGPTGQSAGTIWFNTSPVI